MWRGSFCATTNINAGSVSNLAAQCAVIPVATCSLTVGCRAVNNICSADPCAVLSVGNCGTANSGCRVVNNLCTSSSSGRRRKEVGIGVTVLVVLCSVVLSVLA
jgi:hypothetical protein